METQRAQHQPSQQSSSQHHQQHSERGESGTSPEGLSDRDREILDFERQWWKYAGAKEQAIRDRFDLSATRYYQLLAGIIDRPEALECDPMLVKRLRRMRASRQRARSARQPGTQPGQLG